MLSNDCSQQSDGCSYGLFVILNLASILIEHQLLRIKGTKMARHWIYNLLTNYLKEDSAPIKNIQIHNIPELGLKSLEIATEPRFGYAIVGCKIKSKCKYRLCVDCRKFGHIKHDNRPFKD